MPSATQEFMIAEIKRFTDKLTGKSYTDVIPANGSVVLDVPVLLSFTASEYVIPTLDIQLKMTDPFITPNPPVVDATAVLTYAIAADGKVTLYNNHAGAVTYHVRLRLPMKKTV